MCHLVLPFWDEKNIFPEEKIRNVGTFTFCLVHRNNAFTQVIDVV